MSDRVFERAIAQSVLMDSQLGDDEFPRSFTADSLVTSNCEWWCSGFFPGTLWYIYEYTGNEQILSLAKKQTAKLYGLYNKKTDHDIGFQIKILSFLVIGLANVVSLAGNMIKEAFIFLSEILYKERKHRSLIAISVLADLQNGIRVLEFNLADLGYIAAFFIVRVRQKHEHIRTNNFSNRTWPENLIFRLILNDSVHSESKSILSISGTDNFTATAALLATAFLLGTSEKIVNILSPFALNHDFS